jgi:hypothetical protein
MHINCLLGIRYCNRHHAVVQVVLLDSLSRRNVVGAMALGELIAVNGSTGNIAAGLLLQSGQL